MSAGAHLLPIHPSILPTHQRREDDIHPSSSIRTTLLEGLAIIDRPVGRRAGVDHYHRGRGKDCCSTSAGFSAEVARECFPSRNSSFGGEYQTLGRRGGRRRKKEEGRKESTGGGGIITRQTDRKRDTQEEDAVVRTRLHAPLAYSLSILYHHHYVLAKTKLTAACS